MLSRIVGIVALLAAVVTTGARGQQTYLPDYGVVSPLIATGSSITATYYGWEATTVYGNEIYALTGGQYAADLAAGCFQFSATYRTNCDGVSNQDLAGLLGIPLFGKPYGVTCPVPANACYGSPFTRVFSWIPGSEVIFALMVNQNNGEYNWFFSGDPARNLNQDGSDGYAHLAYFPNGVSGNRGVGTVPGTAGVGLFGFEDVTYRWSDWDFDNAIFAVDHGSIGLPMEVVPEPATLTLLGGGLAGLGALARRRRGRRKTSDA